MNAKNTVRQSGVLPICATLKLGNFLEKYLASLDEHEVARHVWRLQVRRFTRLVPDVLPF
jgi:hypothetical protein